MNYKGKDSEPLSSKALEYYYKHSQVADLHKYFCGDYELTSQGSESESQEAKNELVIPSIQIDEVPTRNPSPASSITSNRKLEWDSGADIGYANCAKNKHLHKSHSLPTVLQNKDSSQLKKTTSEVSSTSYDHNKLVFLSSPSDVEEAAPRERYENTSDVLMFLKLKVGMPIAESTPYDVIQTHSEPVLYQNTPLSRNPQRKFKSDGEAINCHIIVNQPSLNRPITNTGNATVKNVDNTLVDTLQQPHCSKHVPKLNRTSFHYEIVSEHVEDKATQAEIATSSSENIENHDKVESVSIPECADDAKVDDDNQDNAISTPPIQEVEKYPTLNLETTSFNYEIKDNESEITPKSKSDESVLNVFDATLPQRTKYFNRYRNNKIKNLHTTKPQYVECLAPAELEDKIIQTATCTSSNSIATQTEPKHCTSNQTVSYLVHSSSDATSNSDVIVSNCNSFEFVYGSKCKENLTSSSSAHSKLLPPASTSTSTTDHPSQFFIRKQCDDNTTTSSSSTSNYTSKLLTEKTSDDLEDIQRKLSLLNKLIKSNKYDTKTKEYYIKTIAKMLVKSKSNDDSSEYSDKITPVETRHDFSDKLGFGNYENGSGDKAQQHHDLQSNVPWVPATFSSLPKQPEKTRSSLVVSSNSTNHEYCATYSDESHENKKSSFENDKNTFYSDTSHDNKKSSWRDDKTMSERLIERNSSGENTTPTDELLNFAKKERENQLQWIRGEIAHLGKLKELLEKKEKTRSIKIKTKCSSKDIENVKKATSVYMITSEKVKENKGDFSRKLSSDSNVPKTRLECIENRSSEIDFRLYDDMGATDYKFKEIVTRITPELKDSDHSSNTDLYFIHGEGNPKKIIDKPNKPQNKNTNTRQREYNIPTEPDNNPTLISDRSSKTRAEVPTRESRVNRVSRVSKVPCPARPSSAPTQYKLYNDGATQTSYKAMTNNTIRTSIVSNMSNRGPEKISKSQKTQIENIYICTDSNSEVVRDDAISNSSGVESIKTVQKSVTVGPSVTVNDLKHIDWNQCKIIDTNENGRSRRFTIEMPIDDIQAIPFAPATATVATAATVPFTPAATTVATTATTPFTPATTTVTTIATPPTTPATKYASASVQTSGVLLKVSTSDSTSSISTDSTVSCSCCGRYFQQSETTIQESNSHKSVFCPPCFQESHKREFMAGGMPFYQQPQHNCNCYPSSYQQQQQQQQQSTSQNIRTTIQELHDIDKRQKQLEKRCRDVSKKHKQHKHKDKTPVAYLLTFDTDDSIESAKAQKTRSLEEIRVKVPKRGNNLKYEYVDEGGNNKKHGSKKTKDIQDYLMKNKPDFIKAAEERRKCMIELAYMREQRCQKYKQLLALSNGIPMQKPGYTDLKKRLFTTKEMKSMTAKNYKKLPEVQQKLLETRDKQIKKANRLLADIFNKKLKENVLRGKHSLSTSISVINLI